MLKISRIDTKTEQRLILGDGLLNPRSRTLDPTGRKPDTLTRSAHLWLISGE
jgi:hypothetical protein